MSSHVEFSPSSASRWLACPGSIQQSRGIPPRPSSLAAEEGTRAHALAEAMLTKTPYFADLDMAEYVDQFVQFCKELITPASRWSSEIRLTLDRLSPPVPMAGTADFLCHTPERLDIVDLKYGKGVYVEADDNPQLLYYGLMGLLWCESEKLRTPPIIRITIVQPRIEHLGDTIRSVEYTLDDVLGFADRLLAGVDAALAPNPPLVIGSHCRWCPAFATCPKQREQAGAIAQQEFSAVSPETLPAPSTLTDADIGGILERARYLKAWVEALESEAFARLSAGQAVPGWKLGQTKPHRKWIDDDETILRALNALGVSDAEVSHRKLKGITEVEKLLKKEQLSLPDGLTCKPAPSLTLVPERDSRPAAAVNAASEFTAVPHSL